MPRIHILRLILLTIFILAVLHAAAMAFFLYGYYWWFDIPMHFLAGLCVGLAALWCYFSTDWRMHIPTLSLHVLVVALLGAFVVGIAWECFEYSIGLTYNAIGNYRLDTLKDLTMDITGGCAAYLYFISKGYHRNIFK